MTQKLNIDVSNKGKTLKYIFYLILLGIIFYIVYRLWKSNIFGGLASIGGGIADAVGSAWGGLWDAINSIGRSEKITELTRTELIEKGYEIPQWWEEATEEERSDIIAAQEPVGDVGKFFFTTIGGIPSPDETETQMWDRHLGMAERHFEDIGIVDVTEEMITDRARAQIIAEGVRNVPEKMMIPVVGTGFALGSAFGTMKTVADYRAKLSPEELEVDIAQEKINRLENVSRDIEEAQQRVVTSFSHGDVIGGFGNMFDYAFKSLGSGIGHLLGWMPSESDYAKVEAAKTNVSYVTQQEVQQEDVGAKIQPLAQEEVTSSKVRSVIDNIRSQVSDVRQKASTVAKEPEPTPVVEEKKAPIVTVFEKLAEKGVVSSSAVRMIEAYNPFRRR